MLSHWPPGRSAFGPRVTCPMPKGISPRDTKPATSRREPRRAKSAWECGKGSFKNDFVTSTSFRLSHSSRSCAGRALHDRRHSEPCWRARQGFASWRLKWLSWLGASSKLPAKNFSHAQDSSYILFSHCLLSAVLLSAAECTDWVKKGLGPLVVAAFN